VAASTTAVLSTTSRLYGYLTEPSLTDRRTD